LVNIIIGGAIERGFKFEDHSKPPPAGDPSSSVTVEL
jgi:hypothetical protein